MFSAEEAQRTVAEYYKRGEELSAEWLSVNLDKALSMVREASRTGKTEIDYEVNIKDDKYSLAKMKFLLHSLMRLQYKASVSEKITMDGPMKKITTVFTISWS